MKLLYILLCVIAVIYFIAIPSLFNCGKISAGELISLLSVIPLIALALFQEHFKKWFFAPKLEIQFRLQPPYCSKSPFYTFVEDKLTLTTEAYYFRIRVVNKGVTSAKLCEVVMTELLVENGKVFQPVEYSQQVNLKWDTGKTKDAYITLNPSPVGMLCDIGYISKAYEPTLFHLEYLYKIGGYQPDRLAEKVRYRFTIGVISENAKFITKTFGFYWSGVWGNTEEEMFKEINILEV